MTEIKHLTIHERLDVLEERFSKLEKRLYRSALASFAFYIVIGMLQKVL